MLKRFSNATGADYFAIFSAVLMLLSFLFLAFVVEGEESRSGWAVLQRSGLTLSQLVFLFAILGLVGALWRLSNPNTEQKALTMMLVAGTGGIITASVHPPLLFGEGEPGIGFWFTVLGALGLILQFFMVRVSAESVAEEAAAEVHAQNVAEKAGSELAKAWGQHAKDRDDSAIEEFEKLLEANPDDLDAMYGLALARKHSGERAESVAAFKRIQAALAEAQPQTEEEVNRSAMLTRMVEQQLESLEEAGA